VTGSSAPLYGGPASAAIAVGHSPHLIRSPTAPFVLRAIEKAAGIVALRPPGSSNWVRPEILADLTDADLQYSELNSAHLDSAKLDRANLDHAQLESASFENSSVSGAVLAYANLSNATYSPVSQSPAPYIAGIQGLETIRFPFGREDGLIQLRELLQKAGYRDSERAVTFAMERGRTDRELTDPRESPSSIAEGIFRKVAFDWTTAYGLHPARALFLILMLWALMIPIYSFAIFQSPHRRSGIYRTEANDSHSLNKGKSTLARSESVVERLHSTGLGILGWSAYFSLLSTFQIGFRDFSVGTWIARLQTRNFALEPVGWVRTMSGVQALLSVYLLAIWVLTYFGRPFE
jgi:hypothetical protein